MKLFKMFFVVIISFISLCFTVNSWGVTDEQWQAMVKKINHAFEARPDDVANLFRSDSDVVGDAFDSDVTINIADDLQGGEGSANTVAIDIDDLIQQLANAQTADELYNHIMRDGAEGHLTNIDVINALITHADVPFETVRALFGLVTNRSIENQVLYNDNTFLIYAARVLNYFSLDRENRVAEARDFLRWINGNLQEGTIRQQINQMFAGDGIATVADEEQTTTAEAPAGTIAEVPAGTTSEAEAPAGTTAEAPAPQNEQHDQTEGAIGRGWVGRLGNAATGLLAGVHGGAVGAYNAARGAAGGVVGGVYNTAAGVAGGAAGVVAERFTNAAGFVRGLVARGNGETTENTENTGEAPIDDPAAPPNDVVEGVTENVGQIDLNRPELPPRRSTLQELTDRVRGRLETVRGGAGAVAGVANAAARAVMADMSKTMESGF